MAKLWPAAILLTLMFSSSAGAQIIWDNPGSIPMVSSHPTVLIGYLTPKKAMTFSLSNSASNYLT